MSCWWKLDQFKTAYEVLERNLLLTESLSLTELYIHKYVDIRTCSVDL